MSGSKIHVDLSGPPQTMLDMLYGKALDADSPHPILNDMFAKTLVEQLDYDWQASAITRQRRRQVASIVVRGTQFDTWAREFLARHRQAVVLHLGCGLDSRVFRLDPGPGVEWYDVDYPDVISLRERLYPRRDHYHLVAASATDPSWLTAVPTDRPVLLLAEGLSMYLPQAEGLALLRRVLERFPAGEIQLDFWSRLGMRAQKKTNRVITHSGSTLGWTVNRPEEVLAAVPGLRLISAASMFGADTVERLPKGQRRVAKVASRTPGLRKIIQFHRYGF